MRRASIGANVRSSRGIETGRTTLGVVPAFLPRTQRSAQLLRSGALQSRGPACLRLEETGVPVLRSGASQELRAASRPGHVIAFLIQISNSRASVFSRRNASEVCQSLANRARGWMERWEAPGCLRGTLGGRSMDPPRAARHRARPRQGAAPPSAPPATSSSTIPGRPGPASSRSVR